MSLAKISEKPSAADAPADNLESGVAGFCGADRDYWRLLVRGAILLLVTLGLYRFWLTTDMRRFLWSNSALAGEPLEYTGTAIELLLGFLVAVALLVPVYAAMFLALLYQGALAGLAGLLGFALVAVLGPYAVYRARRYRLTRTVFRGVRFHQTGSAWRYAPRALFWWLLAGLTLGLAYPWAHASLERFKMRNTFYGDLPGRFEGSALWLFVRGLPMWALVAGPLLASLVVSFYVINWSALVLIAGQGGDLADDLDITGLAKATGIVMAALGWTGVAAGMLYPSFQALTLRWWASGVHFGGLALRSHLRIGQVYRIYLRFVVYALIFSLAAGAVGATCLFVVGFLAGPDESTSREALVTGLVAAAYVIIALGFSTIYQVTVRLSLWRAAVDTLSVTGLAVLDHVKATGTASSPLGEGLADALNVGGI